MNIFIQPDAEAEIESARQFLEAQRSGLGERFVNDVNLVMAAIASRPESYPKLETLPPARSYRRAVLQGFRYLVVFEILPDIIHVIAVPHTSRAPNYWLSRRW
ncbi:MAG TPA: type II toxin-antitoxin system RelE/ParE family toxin [Planctomycetaceae bacterium]|nr:type II toxin-antitoxin system RelE/ParE family toxin [Planctomycetaceae bacterium]